jgi:hypothetical protein
MTTSLAGDHAGVPALLFQAPPALPQDDPYDLVEESGSSTYASGSRSSLGERSGPTELRMLKAARAAAEGMHISDAQIRAVLENPQDVHADPNQPKRTQFRRDGIVVTTGNDGMILRVTRRRR